MLKELLQNQREYLSDFIDRLDLKQAEQFLEQLALCKGVLIFTGVGKSGLVAEKIAVTMTSTGTRALFLSPNNALHGDIGIISDDDVVVMISKSGESDELLQLIPTIRNKHAKILSIVNNPNSRLSKSSDFSIHLPIKRELCPFDVVPTTSTMTQTLFGDVLAIALMQKKNFTMDAFAANHPAGRIGKRMIMKVSDLMLRGNAIPLCGPKDKLIDTLVELSNKRCGCVLVVDSTHKLLGIFTDGDLRRALQNKGTNVLDQPMDSLMTKAARKIGPDNLAWEAMRVMEGDQKNAITVLPVLENDQVVGLIKLHDIIQSGL